MEFIEHNMSFAKTLTNSHKPNQRNVMLVSSIDALLNLSYDCVTKLIYDPEI